MTLKPEQNETPTPGRATDRAQGAGWQPEVLDGALAAHDLPPDFDLEEVWYWFHSRLQAVGGLARDDARLTAILNWNDVTLGDALRAARLSIDEDEDGDARQAHLEYLTAEFLTRHVLDREEIPAPELSPA